MFREDNERDYACIAYFTAAELAAALITFDSASGGAYSSHIEGTRKELVLCLGNGAKMALGFKQYKRALCLATAAVEAAQSLPTHNSPDAVDENITAKNRRRVESSGWAFSFLIFIPEYG
ncbi:hypothetical protein BDZ97DRAFT_1763893 [Flammula alnicola]|nr:hypothetical protein BDZ97DRAFT_1763893 [Flammula alnicola]